MTTEQQRIKIAEACGWKKVSAPKILCGTELSAMDTAKIQKRFWHESLLPDYLNDLNAMNDAEDCISAWKKTEYWEELIRCVGYTKFQAVHASAYQRAECFLKVMGLWEDQTLETKVSGETLAPSPSDASPSAPSAPELKEQVEGERIEGWLNIYEGDFDWKFDLWRSKEDADFAKEENRFACIRISCVRGEGL